MDRRLTLVCIGLLCCLLGGCIEPEPVPSAVVRGIINASVEPAQTTIYSPEKITVTTSAGSFALTPRANYSLSALVVSKRYYSSGWEAEISPMDLALAWGRMVEPDVDRHLSYSQNGRWYFYTYDGKTPVGKSYIASHSANNHIIPATPNLKAALNGVESDQMVSLEGFLVDVDGRMSGRTVWWRTSLSRTDSASGSCEIFYVTTARIGEKTYK